MSNFGFASDRGAGAQYSQAKDKVMDSLKHFFRPEFLNRLDEIIIFDILSPETIRSIVGIQVGEVMERLRRKEIALSISDAVLDYLAREGYDPKFGARPLKRVIQTKILTPVATMMVGEGMLRGGTVRVDMKKDELSFEVKKRARSAREAGAGKKHVKKPATSKVG
jgi:ATP-dependent Clp protease ATP-binding subunit ClpA